MARFRVPRAGVVTAFTGIIAPAPLFELPFSQLIAPTRIGQRCLAILIRANKANTVPVQIGGPGVAVAGHGFDLDPGESVALQVANMDMVWLVDLTSSGAQTVDLLVLG